MECGIGCVLSIGPAVTFGVPSTAPAVIDTYDGSSHHISKVTARRLHRSRGPGR
jgi:hypothetical protein